MQGGHGLRLVVACPSGGAVAGCWAPYNGGLNVVMGWESEIRNDVSESTMETGVVGCEGRICETAVAGYVRAIVAPLSQ